jgi:hypothetical protein
MVYALKEARRVLRPGGNLVDMDSPPGFLFLGVEVQPGRRNIEPARSRDSGKGELNAQRAVASVVEEGLFRSLEESEFDLVYRFDSVEAMEEYMAAYDALYAESEALSSVDPEVLERTYQAVKRAGRGARPVIVERALFRSLVSS